MALYDLLNFLSDKDKKKQEKSLSYDETTDDFDDIIGTDTTADNYQLSWDDSTTSPPNIEVNGFEDDEPVINDNQLPDIPASIVNSISYAGAVTTNGLPTNPPAGTLFLNQDTMEYMLYSGNEWNILASQSHIQTVVDNETILRQQKEQAVKLALTSDNQNIKDILNKLLTVVKLEHGAQFIDNTQVATTAWVQSHVSNIGITPNSSGYNTASFDTSHHQGGLAVAGSGGAAGGSYSQFHVGPASPALYANGLAGGDLYSSANVRVIRHRATSSEQSFYIGPGFILDVSVNGTMVNHSRAGDYLYLAYLPQDADIIVRMT